MLQRLRLLLTICGLSVILAGCVYHIDIQQGNVITQASADKIHPGMSRTTVVRKIGNPLLSNIYKDGKMVYIYTMKPGRGRFQRRTLIIYFRYDRVVSKKYSTNAPQLPPPSGKH